jgi:hypothetical protein
VLVFLALWLSTLQSFDAQTLGAVKLWYRIVASETVLAFVVGIASVSSCVYWLTRGQGNTSYGIAIWSFVGLLGLLVVAAGLVLWKLVWKS